MRVLRITIASDPLSSSFLTSSPPATPILEELRDQILANRIGAIEDGVLFGV